jgi:hypothetical protein
MGMSLAMGLSLTANRRAGGAAIWSPSELLTGASQLAYYDPSDLTTLFQDSAGTTPVTADGQSVRRVLDKSGNGNHLTQANIANAPLYKTSGGLHWLQFDGTDDFLVSAANLNPGAVDKAQVFAGVRKASDATTAAVVELSSSLTSNSGVFSVFAPVSAAATFTFVSKGTTQAVATSAATFAAPTTRVLTGLGDISGDTATLRLDGAQVAQSTVDQGTGNYISYPLYVGRRAGTTLPFNGNIYSLIVRFSSANLDAAVIDSAEAWTAGKTGVTL